MEVHLTRDRDAIVRHAIKSGRLRNKKEDAVREAFALWEKRDRARTEFLAVLDEAEASLERKQGRTITAESMRELAADVHQSGLAKLAVEKLAPR